MEMEREPLSPVRDGEVMEIVMTRTDKHEFVGVGRVARVSDDLAAVDSGTKLSEVWRRIAESLADDDEERQG